MHNEAKYVQKSIEASILSPSFFPFLPKRMETTATFFFLPTSY